ncbi:MAG: alginate lyase family protein, partial [Planctomycetota bacterium]
MAMRTWRARAAASLVACAVASAAASAGERLFNAARPKYGMRVGLETGPKCGKDKRTPPESTFDGNAHSRCVVWGEPPYSFTIELIDRLPVVKMAFANSDYGKEAAPKKVRIELDDGTVLEHALEVKRPVRRRPAWQELAVGKPAQTIKVTVLSNHPGEVNWGGLAEIAVFTSADLNAMLAIPDHDPKAPVFVEQQTQATGEAPEVHLPPVLPEGEHPRCLFTRAELAELRKTVKTAERAKAPYEALIAAAKSMLSGKLDFPDPEGTPAQLKDRRDPIVTRHVRLSRGCGSLGMAYALTGDVAYARRAREILVGYAERYAAYPEHKGVNRSDTGKVMAQRLSEAMWLIPQAHAYDLIQGTGVLSDADRQAIETKLLRPCVAFIRRKDPSKEAAERTRRRPDWRTGEPRSAKGRRVVGNWVTFYAAATMMAGGAMEDRDLIDLAAADARFAIVHGIGADGMWGEGAIGYQMFALQALVIVFETAARQGID